MNAMYLMIPALCILAIAYRFYSAFLATRVAMLDATAVTPAHTKYDGHNYYPLSRWVLFGHHFAAITGAGPLIGPVLAVQFGYFPGFVWLVIGVCLAGAVHDFMILWASTRREGRSLAEIARDELGPVAGTTAGIAILFIIVIALAGLGLAVVNALRESIWGTYTIAMTIPIPRLPKATTEVFLFYFYTISKSVFAAVRARWSDILFSRKKFTRKHGRHGQTLKIYFSRTNWFFLTKT